MRPINLIIKDAVTLRGIIDLLEEAPATTREIVATQHVGGITAGRCCDELRDAGIIHHPTVTRIVIGAPTQVPQLAWSLTAAYQRGEIVLDAEKMAGGI